MGWGREVGWGGVAVQAALGQGIKWVATDGRGASAPRQTVTSIGFISEAHESIN